MDNNGLIGAMVSDLRDLVDLFHAVQATRDVARRGTHGMDPQKIEARKRLADIACGLMVVKMEQSLNAALHTAEEILGKELKDGSSPYLKHEQRA